MATPCLTSMVIVVVFVVVIFVVGVVVHQFA
jgi:hypothetical protein